MWAAPLCCWWQSFGPRGATCGRRADLFASGVRVYARRCVVIVLACSGFGTIPQPAQEMQAGVDGVSDARTEFVRDVSDGSRPVYRRLLFLLVSLQAASSAAPARPSSLRALRTLVLA